MTDPEDLYTDDEEITLNTNEVMRDYEFYLKMYIERQRMDFEDPTTERKAS